MTDDETPKGATGQQLAITFSPRAVAMFSKLDLAAQVTIRDRLLMLSAGFQEAGSLKLHVRKLIGKFAGYYRLRVGAYRVIFKIERESIWVVAVAHRKEVYRKRPGGLDHG